MRYILYIISSLLIFSCTTYKPSEKPLAEFDDGSVLLRSFYRKVNDTIEFRRILTTKFEFAIQKGEIFDGYYGFMYQKFTDRYKLRTTKENLESLEKQFIGEGFVPKLVAGRDVMFIQIVRDKSMSNNESLEFAKLQCEVEKEIGQVLQSKNLGQVVTGRRGAGADMQFFVDDWTKANIAVIEVLSKEDLLGQVFITRRILTSKDAWSYEIVYPSDYQGVFDPM